MIIYLHMHKCAGTTVVRSALASGLRLPARHRNGNLLHPDDSPIKYRRMSREDLHALLRQQIDDGVEFMAMEWDFPRFEMFEGIEGLRFFTTLREPLARAVSNFKMDKVAGWCDRDTRFADYINGDALYRSDNYYVKILCQLWPKDTVRPEDEAYARAVLDRFEAVIVVEQGHMAAMLERFGIMQETRKFNTFSRDSAEEKLGDDVVLEPDQTEIRAYLRANAADYAIYRHYTRLARGAA